MVCPKCKSTQIKVVDSRDNDDNTKYRRRACISCGFRWNTVEVSEVAYMGYLLMDQCSQTEKKRKSKQYALDKKAIIIALSDIITKINNL